MNRPELQKMLEFAREGDTIFIESISRLARNTIDFLLIVEQFKTKNIGLVSLKESIDTQTPQGQFILTVFGALAQLERDTIRQRQREGQALAKAEGRMCGRPKAKSNDFNRVYAEWKSGRMKAVDAMRETGLKKTTFYARVKLLENGT